MSAIAQKSLERNQLLLLARDAGKIKATSSNTAFTKKKYASPDAKNGCAIIKGVDTQKQAYNIQIRRR